MSNIIKKIMYKSSHRGCKETDLILGKFTEKYIDCMSDSELIEFTKILSLNDVEIYDFITSKKKLPKKYNTKLFHKIISFTHSCFL